MSVSNDVVLGTESGAILQTQSGADILLEAPVYSFPAGPPDVRITVLSPSTRFVVELDASGDLQGQWQVRYEKTPGGCGAGEIDFGLRYEEAFERGYLTAMNIVEISTGDDVLQANILAGATKLYVSSTVAYGYSWNGSAYVNNGEATQQIYLWDGSHLTMRIPVTGAGQDSLGPYITVGSPLAGGGNPTTIPAYTAGATIVGRRRYAGMIALRDRQKTREPKTVVTLQPLANIFNLTQGSYSVGSTAANNDVGAVMYSVLSTFGLPGSGFSTTLNGGCSVGATSLTVASNANMVVGYPIELDYGLPTQEIAIIASLVGGTGVTLESGTLYAHSNGAAAQSISRWPQLVLNSANFPTVGIPFQGSRTSSPVMTMLQDFVGAISSGDVWSVIVDHDRAIKLVRLYTLATNTYSFPVTLTQGEVDFEPLNIDVQDQNISNIYNAVLVTGATNLATQVPYSAVVNDPSAIVVYDYLQLDGNPVSNTSLNSNTACAQYGAGLLAQSSLAQEQVTFRVFTRDDFSPAFEPEGVPGGDAVRGTDAVTLVGFDQVGVSANNLPDSEMIGTFTAFSTQAAFYAAQSSNPGNWTAWNLSVVDDAGPAGSNAIELTASGSGIANSPFLYVAPGRVFSLSIYIDASHASAGTIEAQIFANAGTPIATVSQTPGTASTLTFANITLPAGSNVIALQLYAAGVTLSGGSLIFSQPMLASGGSVQSYVPNYAAPAVYGLVSSAVTTLTAHGDRYQDVTFNPVQPDWTSAIAEAQNAVANSIRANQAAGTSLAAFTLSSNFSMSYTGSSLVVTVPQSVALFAAGTPPVVIGGNSFTLPASALTWVWLNPNNTYTFVGNPTSVAGAILLGFFSTSSIGVNGFTPKYSQGLVQLSTFNYTTINPANGYITISDQIVHLTPQTYALPAAGVGSTVTAGWSFQLGSATADAVIWLFANANATTGYAIEWSPSISGYVTITKYVSGTPTVLATSSSAYSATTAALQSMQVIATETSSGSVWIAVILNGQIVVLANDTSSPISSGYIGAQFVGTSATNYIDPNSVNISTGGAPNSSGLKAQANVLSISIPSCTLAVVSPTAGVTPYGTSGPLMWASTNGGTIYFPDGSSLAWQSQGGVQSNTGANGTWYASLSLVLATGTFIYYLSQTAPTNAQLAAFIADGVVPVIFNQSFTVAAGSYGNVVSTAEFRHTS